MTDGPPTEDRQELLKLYELALQEYRFQVLLNWDRLKHVFVTDGVLVGAAAGIWKLGSQIGPPKIVGWILGLVTINSLLGIVGSRTGHGYYRETRAVKAALETKLGLPSAGFALTTTAGMREHHQPTAVPLTPGKKFKRFATRVTSYLEVVLFTVAFLSAWEAVLVWAS